LVHSLHTYSLYRRHPHHPASLTLLLFFFYCHGAHRDLHSFPTRRSSDLYALTAADCDSGSPPCNTTKAPPVSVTLSNTVPSVSQDRKSTRLNSSHVAISYAVFCLKKKKKHYNKTRRSHRIATDNHQRPYS